MLGAHALGALEPEETATVRAHLAACSSCAAEYATVAGLPSLLTLAGGADAAVENPLPPAFEERLLDAYSRDRARTPDAPPPRRRPRFRRRAFALAAAGLAAAAIAVAVLVSQTGDRSYPVALEGVGATPAASARARLEHVDSGTTVHMWVEGLPADPDTVYEVRCEAPGWSASAGTFRVDSDGRAYVELTTAARRGQYDAIRVVRRPDGDAVLAGRLS
jgi:anti-sigma factor RsiW